MTRPSRLEGKVAIVTGGGTGIGRATAQLYAQEGAKVVVADIRAEDAEETMRSIRDSGGEATFVSADVSRGSDVEGLVGQTEELYGALHVVTANAGILGRASMTPLVDLSEEDVEQVMGVNFWGVWRSFKHAIPLVRRSGGGSFTATASVAAVRGYAGLSSYCASKAAVCGLVRSLALELAGEIRVNAVAPGGVATEIQRHTAEETGKPYVSPASGKTEDAAPWYRIADPSELAHAHLWLASDDSSFVTGQTLVVDGGRATVVT
jgi:NAD(P)-dependent dehydrogenase (short-subunit alcohol dehydrogenase family)